MEIKKITEDDKKFLERFENCELLALNRTQMESCDNLPAMEHLTRVSKPKLVHSPFLD